MKRGLFILGIVVIGGWLLLEAVGFLLGGGFLLSRGNWGLGLLVLGMTAVGVLIAILNRDRLE